MYTGSGQDVGGLLILGRPAHLQQQTAQRVLTRFQEHQDAWQRVPAILEASQNINTKVRSSGGAVAA